MIGMHTIKNKKEMKKISGYYSVKTSRVLPPWFIASRVPGNPFGRDTIRSIKIRFHELPGRHVFPDNSVLWSHLKNA